MRIPPRWAWRIAVATLTVILVAPLLLSRLIGSRTIIEFQPSMALRIRVAHGLLMAVFDDNIAIRSHKLVTADGNTPTNRAEYPALLNQINELALECYDELRKEDFEDLAFRSSFMMPTLGILVHRDITYGLTETAIAWWLPALTLLPLGLTPLALALWKYFRNRKRPGHCPTCNYNLTGLPTPRCPECGNQLESAIL